jgi:hypothetical protein
MTNTYMVYPTNTTDPLLRREFHTYKHAGQYANRLVESGTYEHVTIDILLHTYDHVTHSTTTSVLQSVPVKLAN